MLTAADSLSRFMDEEALQMAEVRLSGHHLLIQWTAVVVAEVASLQPGCLLHAHALESCMTSASLHPGRPRCAATLHGRDAGRGVLSGLHVLAATR